MATIINTESGLSGKTPGFSVTSDVSGTLQLQTNSNTAVTIDSSQNVGIGTTSPVTGYRLSLYDATNGASNISGLVLIEPGASTSYSYFKTTSQASSDTRTIIGNSSVSRALAFETGGTERARIDSSGNLGLGVTPSAWGSGIKAIQFGLGANVFGSTSSYNNTNIVSNMYYNSGGTAIYQGSDYASFYQQVSGQHKWFNAASGTAGNAITFTQAMTLDASGNLGIGVTSVASPSTSRRALQISNSTSGGIIYLSNDGTESNNPRIFGSGSTQYDLGFAAGSSTGIINWYTNGIERARIDSSGNLLVGRTSSAPTSTGFQVAQSGYVNCAQSGSTNAATTYEVYSTGAATYRFYVGLGGTIFATSTTISAISDARFKENVRDLDAGLAEVMALKPRLYDWKEGKGADIKNARGFIAQEFEEVFPDLIDEWKDPAPEGEDPYKSVRQDLIPVLVKAIQEQQALIQTLTARITALEGA